MAFPPIPFQEWFLRQTSAGNAALNAYVARVKADGGVVEAIGCVPLGVWDWAAPSYVGLLDLYPNAAAAYSLRKLRAAYSGSAVRVRKEVSSVSSETDIGFLADGTLDTVSLLAFASDADSGDVFVVTWYDQSLSNDATQGTAANQPKIVSGGSLVTEGTSAKPAVDFDGGVTYNSLEKQFASSLSQPVTIFGVMKNNDGNKDHFYDGYSNRFSFGYDTTNLTINAGSSISAGAYPTGSKLISNLYNTTGSELNINGVTEASGNVGANTMDGIIIGTLRTSVSTVIRNEWSLSGNLQEIIIYPSDQSTNRTGIETNINTFYSIYP